MPLASAETQNKEITRIIDATTNVVRVFSTIQATGTMMRQVFFDLDS